MFTIRCIFNGGEESAQEGVITLYLKDMSINIEVSLYKELSKMSIASSVHALDLFGDDPEAIPFKERITLLNSMMEKFFVISEGSIYHMKVESDAVPVQTYLEEKRREAVTKNPKENKAQEHDVILTAQKIREIRDEKEQYSSTDKATRYSRFTDIDGQMHEVEMLFIKKTETKTGKGGGRGAKRFSTYGKSQIEKVQIQIEQYLEEQCEWDSIYFEISDQNQGEPVTALHDKKKIAQMLAKDEYFDWKSAMGQVDPLLLDYIKSSIKVNPVKGEVWLHNKENIEQNILQKYRKQIGGKYLMRVDLDLTPDEQKIVAKQMIVNTEIEMSEFLYDIKIYQIHKLADKDVIAYQLELFTLNDPEVVYQYTYPMNFNAVVQDPHSLMFSVINLIEHPLDQNPALSKLQKKGTTVTNSGAPLNMSPAVNYSQSKVSAPVVGGGSDNQMTTQDKEVADKTTFQQLFRKYIDNRMLLVVQETRFPRKLEFVLTEPCSQLSWRGSVEPRQISTGMASMHLVDIATLEMFVAVLLDENQNCAPGDDKVFEYRGPKVTSGPDLVTVNVCENFAEVQEAADEAKFLRETAIPETDLTLSIRKKRDAFSLSLKKRSGG